MPVICTVFICFAIVIVGITEQKSQIDNEEETDFHKLYQYMQTWENGLQL